MMPDPMAESATTNVSLDNEKEFFDPMILQFNRSKLERMQSILGIAAGCMTGICGVTGLPGFGRWMMNHIDGLLTHHHNAVCFLAWHLSTCAILWAVKMKFQLKTFTRQSWFDYTTSTLQQNGLSFTLFWTLFYGLVYLY